MAPVIQGVLLTGKAGQQWALRQAPFARWSLHCERPCGEQELSRLLAAAARSLALRGGRRTVVHLSYDHGPATDAALAALAQGLSGAGAGVSELKLLWERLCTGMDAASSNAVAHFVRNVVPSVFPNLTSINFGLALYPLPPPNHMPQLRDVTASSSFRHSDSALAFIDSVALYLPQLDSLGLGGVCVRAYETAAWKRLFHPASTSHTLTHFDASSRLTDELLTLLLNHAPALTQLEVGGLHEELGDHSGKEWGVGCVRVGSLRGFKKGTTALSKLPRLRGGGRVVIRGWQGHSKPRLSLTARVGV